MIVLDAKSTAHIIKQFPPDAILSTRTPRSTITCASSHSCTTSLLFREPAPASVALAETPTAGRDMPRTIMTGQLLSLTIGRLCWKLIASLRLLSSTHAFDSKSILLFSMNYLPFVLYLLFIRHRYRWEC